MESEKQCGDMVRAECSSAREEEEMETFFALIRRLGELRRKKDELFTIHSPNADVGDHDQVKYNYSSNNKKIKLSVNDHFNHDQENKKEESIISSDWVPCFRLEDFGEDSGSRRSPSSPAEEISYKVQQQEVTKNSKQSMLIQVRDNDGLGKHHQLDDDHCGLNLRSRSGTGSSHGLLYPTDPFE